MSDEMEKVAAQGELVEFRVYYWSVKCQYSDRNSYCVDYINYYMQPGGPTDLTTAKFFAHEDGWRQDSDGRWTCVACRHRYSLM